VLVGRLGQADNAGFLRHSLTVGHDRVRHLDGNTSMVFLQIFQADFQVKLTSTSNDVLAGFLNDALKKTQKISVTSFTNQ
jgi:hypothetical protein